MPKARKDSTSEGNDSTQLWAMVPRTGMPKTFPAMTLEVAAAPPIKAARAALKPAVGSLGPAHAELHDRVSGGGNHDPGGFRGHQGLKIDDVQEGGFDELGFGERGRDPDDGFLGKDERPFRDGENIAGETEAAKIFDDFLGKQIPDS